MTQDTMHYGVVEVVHDPPGKWTAYLTQINLYATGASWLEAVTNLIVAVNAYEQGLKRQLRRMKELGQ